ncbi:hypothetical protein M427DRAFT_57905 [Gonapodya prolifera JEL478]|uniref:Uncharacterized protein n=1 Tax=Gonapodya prolifera (strain JEL478) TaxID=1344416 RepID=A0A139ACF8_GONPJ|nr:hypothetical protein M427DRAFT_57905 [Gonapodya prolifera JEL478]|eukprot:KXS14135.1 hypothetical protein M427DRAFT_57905 [Gonapodya prolifera JEL478]
MAGQGDLQSFFAAIKQGDSKEVRRLLEVDKSVTSMRTKDAAAKYEPDVEMDAFKFLGAYIGSINGLQLALFTGHDDIARDIIDATFQDEIDSAFGGGNTALHLAALLGAEELVSALLTRGASKTSKNNKGFTPVDVGDDDSMRQIFSQH